MLACGLPAELPQVLAGGLSHTPLVPIWSRRLLPSCDHFWTMPSPLPAIQMLSWWSTKHPWMLLGSTARSPQAFTTLPSRSYSRTGGDATAVTVSGAIRLPRLTVMTWSWESTHVPPGSPVTQGFPLTGSDGSGFGQNGSTMNRGTWLLFAVAWPKGFHNPR